MLQQKIPATVITGFLGAGKTTMIRNLLMNANGKRIALIINEFGDLGVDGDVLKGCGAEACTEDDIIELTNGCICCTVADDCLIGMGARVLNGAFLGPECLVGANALITEGKRFEEGGLIVGAPARLVRPLSDTEKAALRLSAAHYAEKAAHYATDLELHR